VGGLNVNIESEHRVGAKPQTTNEAELWISHPFRTWV